MIPGWFFMVPGQFISELSAGACSETLRTPQKVPCILAPRSRQALPAVGRLWPSDVDGDGDVHRGVDDVHGGRDECGNDQLIIT